MLGEMKMNREFEAHIGRVKANFEALMATPLHPYSVRSKFKKAEGIYVLIEDGKPVYVGRTRNLSQRLQAHVSASHNSASYAVKRVRQAHGLEASYKPEMSRLHITTVEPWRGYFLEEIQKIRGMQFRFLKVEDPVDQYLLELYATMELDLELSGFDTH